MPPYDRPSPRERKLREQAARQDIRSSRTASNVASQSAMMQQLRSLYDIGQDSAMQPSRLEAAGLANRTASAQLDYLPREMQLKEDIGQANIAANRAQAAAYAQPDRRDVASMYPEGVPDPVRTALLPPEARAAMEAQQAQKATEKAKLMAQQEQIAQSGAVPGAMRSPDLVGSGTRLREGLTDVGRTLQYFPAETVGAGMDFLSGLSGIKIDPVALAQMLQSFGLGPKQPQLQR